MALTGMIGQYRVERKLGAGAMGHLSGPVNSVYNEIRNEPPPCGVGPRIDLSTPTNSLILRKPSENGVTHSGGAPWLNQPEYDRMLLWIQQGALNN